MKNHNRPKNIAIILAGGSGTRFKSETPKQFIKLAGRLVVEYSVEVFEYCNAIDQIVVVAPHGYENLIWELANQNNWSKLKIVVKGGASRNASTMSALSALSAYPPDTRIILHDAARPLLEPATIQRCLNALTIHQAVDTVVPSSDTVVEVDIQQHISHIPNREKLRRGQTPQGFHLGILKSAYEKADLKNLSGITCDCSLLHREFPELTITTVPGDESNIKITNPMDLYIAEKLIQARKTKNLAHFSPKDIHGKVIAIIGGSSGIGASIAKLAQEHQAHVHVASRRANQININQKNNIDQFLASIEKQHGRIDIVINTAGLLIKRPLKTCKTEEIHQIVSTNLTSAITLAQSAYPFIKNTRGCLVNFSSSSYTRGRAFYAAYSATKAGIVNFTQALAEEWSTEGIRVICISPERTRTPMRQKNFGIEPDGSLLEPEAVARETLSAIFSMMTGVIFDVRRSH